MRLDGDAEGALIEKDTDRVRLEERDRDGVDVESSDASTC